MNEKEIIVIKENPKKGTTGKVNRLKVAAYARVSSEKEAQLNSLESQKQHYDKYIKSKVEWKHVGIYFDEGISGLSTKKREGFNKMIHDAIDGKIDLIITKSISRFARNVVDTISITRKLKTLNVGVFFEKENLNSLDPTSDFILAVLASAAEEESKTISSNVRWGIRSKYKEGKFGLPYSSIFGFKKGIKKYEIVINKEEAPIVRLIYMLYLETFSSRYIAYRLNLYNIPTPFNKIWNKTVINSILTNEKYMGDALLQKTFVCDIFTQKYKKNEGELKQYYIKNNHEAIVPREVFKEVSNKKRIHDNCFSCAFPYSSILKCGCCGNNYQINYYYYKHKSPTQTIARWICSKKYANSIRCKNIVLYNDELDFVTNQLYLLLFQKYPNIIKFVNSLLEEIGIEISKINPNNIAQNKYIRLITFRVIAISAIVNQDRSIDFTFIDGSVFHYNLPYWSPTKRQIWNRKIVNKIRIVPRKKYKKKKKT